MILVDTSALYALIDEADPNHTAAAEYFRGRLGSEPHLTHSYVLVETTALLQHRFGLAAVRQLANDLEPALDIIGVDEATHAAARVALLTARSRRVSLVDRVSFELMRRRGIRAAFAFDEDFAAAGLDTVP